MPQRVQPVPPWGSVHLARTLGAFAGKGPGIHGCRKAQTDQNGAFNLVCGRSAERSDKSARRCWKRGIARQATEDAERREQEAEDSGEAFLIRLARC